MFDRSIEASFAVHFAANFALQMSSPTSLKPGCPISVCMISGPEEQRIRRTLESVRSWTSEIIVVLNQEVSDRTEEIARELGAKVVREPWKGYAAQKNSACEKATQEWILNLDADEVISEKLRDEIIDCLSRSAAAIPHAAFSFPRCTLFLGRWIRHGDWYPDRKTRLWRRGQAEWQGEGVHEKLVVDGNVRRLKHPLLHFGTTDLDDHIRKMLRYTREFAEASSPVGPGMALLNLAVRPPWRFVRAFFLRLGFLDGWQGFAIAWIAAFYTFLRYLKSWEKQHTADPPSEPQPPERPARSHAARL
jgi:glycosyltransferase involved in cell wall biosynthesis